MGLLGVGLRRTGTHMQWYVSPPTHWPQQPEKMLDAQPHNYKENQNGERQGQMSPATGTSVWREGRKEAPPPKGHFSQAAQRRWRACHKPSRSHAGKPTRAAKGRAGNKPRQPVVRNTLSPSVPGLCYRKPGTASALKKWTFLWSERTDGV